MRKLNIKHGIPGVGARGEGLAIYYLRTRGYGIICINYRTKFGEIDIVARDCQGTLVFIEVKTLSGNLDSRRNLLPEDNLSLWKMHKLQRVCNFFANAHPDLVSSSGWQIDLIAIVTGPKSYKVKHYKNL